MLTDLRWQKEQELMNSVFPQFKPFAEPLVFGFEGHLVGRKSGRLYRVVIEGDKRTYPQCPPIVRMNPRIAEHWVEQRGGRALCMLRDWQPATSTFANTVLAVVRFLDEHDAVSCIAQRTAGGNPARRLPHRP